jgi:hypothetical protein
MPASNKMLKSARIPRRKCSGTEVDQSSALPAPTAHGLNRYSMTASHHHRRASRPFTSWPTMRQTAAWTGYSAKCGRRGVRPGTVVLAHRRPKMAAKADSCDFLRGGSELNTTRL